MNAGFLTAKELVDLMQRSKVDILCIQETRCKGNKSRRRFQVVFSQCGREMESVILKEFVSYVVLEMKNVRVILVLMSHRWDVSLKRRRNSGVRWMKCDGENPQK